MTPEDIGKASELLAKRYRLQDALRWVDNKAVCYLRAYTGASRDADMELILSVPHTDMLTRINTEVRTVEEALQRLGVEI